MAASAIIGFSSFKGSEAKADRFDAVTLYYQSNGTWSTATPDLTKCGASNLFCSISYDDENTSLTPQQVAALVEQNYNPAASSNTGDVITVGTGSDAVEVTIIERSGF